MLLLRLDWWWRKTLWPLIVASLTQICKRLPTPPTLKQDTQADTVVCGCFPSLLCHCFVSLCCRYVSPRARHVSLCGCFVFIFSRVLSLCDSFASPHGGFVSLYGHSTFLCGRFVSLCIRLIDFPITNVNCHFKQRPLSKGIRGPRARASSVCLFLVGPLSNPSVVTTHFSDNSVVYLRSKMLFSSHEEIFNLLVNLIIVQISPLVELNQCWNWC